MASRWNLWQAMMWRACIGALVATFDLIGHWDMSQAADQWSQIAGGGTGGGIGRRCTLMVSV